MTCGIGWDGWDGMNDIYWMGCDGLGQIEIDDTYGVSFYFIQIYSTIHHSFLLR